MQSHCAANPVVAMTHMAPVQPQVPNIDEALNSSAWFQQQRFWEQTTRFQTQLLTLLQSTPTPTTDKSGVSTGRRRTRRNSIAPTMPTLKKPSNASVDADLNPPPSHRRRGSWTPTHTALMIDGALPSSAEADALKAIQLLALQSRPSGRARSKSDVSSMRRRSGSPGKAKEAEPSSSPDSSLPSVSASYPERRNVMAISSLLN